MKKCLIIFSLLFIFKASAQVSQYTVVENENEKSYYSFQHISNTTVFKNQPYLLKRKLENIILNKEQNPKNSIFYKCFSQSELDMMRNNKAIIFVEYIVDETGKTMSAAVLNRRKNNYSLSENSIDCVLSTALNQTFMFKYVPTDLPENYLLRIRMSFYSLIQN